MNVTTTTPIMEIKIKSPLVTALMLPNKYPNKSWLNPFERLKKITDNAIPRLMIIGIEISEKFLYALRIFSIPSAPSTENTTPEINGLITSPVTLVTYSPNVIPPNEIWDNASAIKLRRLTTINAPNNGAIRPTISPLINEYLIKSNVNSASIIMCHLTTLTVMIMADELKRESVNFRKICFIQVSELIICPMEV